MYPDRNRTTRSDMKKIADAIVALRASNGVCPFSLTVDGRTVRTFTSAPVQTTARPDATMICTQTVGMVADGLQMTIEATEYLEDCGSLLFSDSLLFSSYLLAFPVHDVHELSFSVYLWKSDRYQKQHFVMRFSFLLQMKNAY